jgi:hypothetical protein
MHFRKTVMLLRHRVRAAMSSSRQNKPSGISLLVVGCGGVFSI